MPTTVRAKARDVIKKGTSGKGSQIGRLLRSANTPDATEFLEMLARVKKSNPSHMRSPFSCAEPHAFALLLNKGFSLSEIQIIGEAQETHLSRTISECDNCMQWLFNGKYCPPDFDKDDVKVQEPEAVREADLSSHRDFVLDSSDFPAFKTTATATTQTAAKPALDFSRLFKKS